MARLRLLLVLLGFFTGVLAFIGVILSNEYRVERSVVINSDRASIHKFIADLGRWEEWTPWQEADPTLQITQGDVTRGVGASRTWQGKEGNGRLKITRADVNEGIQYDLWLQDDSMHCVSILSYQALNRQLTRVVWGLQGSVDVPVLGGYMAALMDSFVGEDLEKGLSKLKQVAEFEAAGSELEATGGGSSFGSH